MATVTAESGTALDWFDENQQRFSDFNKTIWDLAEPAWREYRSAKAYVDLLRQEGFDVEEGSAEMPTAFMATWGSGGPVIGSYAEYDAVPGTSQAVVPYRQPRPGLHPYAAGHTDPHSGLGVAGLTGILAAKRAMEKHGIKGTLRFFGEPAEKVCGSKPIHAAKGYYDGMDASICYHPKGANTTVWDTQCGSYWSAIFSFTLDESAETVDPSLLAFAGHPHSDPRPPGAVAALSAMMVVTEQSRQAMYPNTGTWTLSSFVMVGGEATADNLPGKFAQIQYSWRAPALGIQEQIARVLENNARHAAAVAGCRAHMRWVSKTRVGLTNHVLAQATYDNLQRVGPSRFPEEAREFGREIQRNLGIEPMDDPFTEACQSLISPQEYEAQLRTGLPEWQKNFTSDDYVEYTWHSPSVRLFTGRPSLRQPHSQSHWAAHALGGLPAAIDPMWNSGGKTIALTVLDLLTDPDLLDAAKREFEERTGGGVGGDRWVAPLLPPDFKPPVNQRWPEYIQTERGSEWWIPTDEDFGVELS